MVFGAIIALITVSVRNQVGLCRARILLLNVQAAKKDKYVYHAIEKLLDRIQAVIERFPREAKAETSSALQQFSTRILLGMLRVFGIYTQLIGSGQRLAPSFVAARRLVHDEEVVSCVDELRYFVDGAVSTLSSPGERSDLTPFCKACNRTDLANVGMESPFQDIWSEAMRVYTSSTGNDTNTAPQFRGIDSVDRLRSALAAQEYTFHGDTEGQIRTVLRPMLHFLSGSVATAADYAGDVCP